MMGRFNEAIMSCGRDTPIKDALMDGSPWTAVNRVDRTALRIALGTS
jgi:hypothetical protein